MAYTRRLAGALLLALAMPWAAIAASDSGLDDERRSALEQRVRERWSAMAARDFGRVWEFTTPNFRKAFPKSLYVHNFSYMVEWELTGVEVLHYDADAAVASVKARVMTWPVRPTSTASEVIGDELVIIREKWMSIDGEWWHVANY